MITTLLVERFPECITCCASQVIYSAGSVHSISSSGLDKLKGTNRAKLVRPVGVIKLDASSWAIYLFEPTSNATDVKFLVLNAPSKLQTAYV